LQVATQYNFETLLKTATAKPTAKTPVFHVERLARIDSKKFGFYVIMRRPSHENPNILVSQIKSDMYSNFIVGCNLLLLNPCSL